MIQTPERLAARLAQAARLWLFLDYDGTLADFAPTPEHVNPDPEVVDLIGRLQREPGFRVAVVSGRRLSHVQELVPVPGVLLALNAIACFAGPLGLVTGVEILEMGTVVGGFLFLLALFPLSAAFLRMDAS